MGFGYLGDVLYHKMCRDHEIFFHFSPFANVREEEVVLIAMKVMEAMEDLSTKVNASVDEACTTGAYIGTRSKST